MICALCMCACVHPRGMCVGRSGPWDIPTLMPIGVGCVQAHHSLWSWSGSSSTYATGESPCTRAPERPTLMSDVCRRRRIPALRLPSPRRRSVRRSSCHRRTVTRSVAAPRCTSRLSGRPMRRLWDTVGIADCRISPPPSCTYVGHISSALYTRVEVAGGGAWSGGGARARSGAHFNPAFTSCLRPALAQHQPE